MKENSIARVPFDYRLLIAVVFLTGIGLTMVFSTSAVLAEERFGDSLFFLKRAALYAALGFFFMMILMRIPYVNLRKVVYPLLFFCLLLNLLVLFSPLGVSVGGARRWLKLGFFALQPSELTKIAIILFMAYSLEKKKENMERFGIGVLTHILITGFLILLVLKEKDLGSAFIMGWVVFAMLFLAGARLKHLGLLFLTTLPFLYYLITKETYRLQRVLSFLNPWGDRLGSGFQIIQSLLAFNEGGLFGKGLGAGQQKLFYLPEAHTDFIFSVLGEELGLIGVSITICLFVYLSFRGIKIGKTAPDLFGRYLGLGIVILIAAQSLFNMAIVMGMLPTKGLVLPLVGYGGSSLVTTLMAIGILLNLSTYQMKNGP